MPILNISTARIYDAAAFEDYVSQAADLMRLHGVTVVARGRFLKSMTGEPQADHIAAVFRYPDLATAEGFFSSDAYQALLPLRQRACDMVIKLYDGAIASETEKQP